MSESLMSCGSLSSTTCSTWRNDLALRAHAPPWRNGVALHAHLWRKLILDEVA